MRPSLATFAAMLLLPAVLACTAQPPQREDHAGAAATSAQASGPLCHVGPDGRPLAPDPLAPRRLVSDRLVSDRGIGGTGGPAAAQIVDRGIGGTGIGGTGIGGTGIGGTGIGGTGIGATGILGVITGFGSICVDGLEVQYDETTTVDVDGRASSTATLRAGQVVALRADGAASAARARTISVRSEISGRMEDGESSSGARMIGGQPVFIPPGIWGAGGFAPGDWVTVNGLRRQDGVIVASRLDPAPAGSLVVRGQVRREAGIARIGGLVLRGPVADGLKPGQSVTASGHYITNQGGANQGWVSTVVPDMASNPMALFGGSVDHIVWQAFLRADKDTVWLNGFKVATTPGVRGRIGADGVAIVTLDRDQDGSYTAVDLRYLDDPGLGTVVLPTGGRAIADASSPALRSRPMTVPPAPMDAAAQAVNANRARFAPARATRGTVLDSGPPRAVSLPAPASMPLTARALTAEPPMTPASVPVAPTSQPTGLPTPEAAPSSSASPASQFMSDKDSATAADPASVKAAALTQPGLRARHVLTESTRGPGVTTITTMTQSTAAVSPPSAGVAAAAPPNAHAGGLAAAPARSGKSDARPPRDTHLQPAD